MMTDEMYMKVAQSLALRAYEKGDVPVGCIIVYKGRIVAKAYNMREAKKLVTRHAEIVAIERACRELGTKFLDETTLYVTLEPCLMCVGTIMQARISRVVYGAAEPKFGCAKSLGNAFVDYKSNHTVTVEGGILEEEISEMMKKFFKELRSRK